MRAAAILSASSKVMVGSFRSSSISSSSFMGHSIRGWGALYDTQSACPVRQPRVN